MPNPKRLLPHGYIYVIQGEGHFKVGKTTMYPAERLASMQSAHPTTLTLVAWEPVAHDELDKREKEAHEQFDLWYKRSRPGCRTEWYVGTITPSEAFDGLQPFRVVEVMGGYA